MRITYGTALRLGYDTVYTALVHLVRHDDELYLGVVVYQRQEYVFVGSPRRPCHKQRFVGLEPLNDVDALHPLGDGRHAVETRIPRHDHIVEADIVQQMSRLLVLDENLVERIERLPPQETVAAEEDRVAAEDGRDDERARTAALELREVVYPELVLDEYCNLGVRQIEETAYVPRRVDRHVEDVIGPLVVLAHLVARGREKCQKYLVMRIIGLDLLHDGTSLFELSERGHMYPYYSVRGRYRAGHAVEDPFSADGPFFGLVVPQRGQRDQACIYGYTEII